MGKDCPDRQRGASYRDGPAGPPGPAGRIGAGDAVDREYEVRSSIRSYHISMLTFS